MRREDGLRNTRVGRRRLAGAAAAQAVEWAKKNKGATPKDADDQQMDKVRTVALKNLEAIKDAGRAGPRRRRRRPRARRRPRSRVVEAPAKNGAVVMAEALYQATHEDVLRLVPSTWPEPPVALCGGINVITGWASPTFACKNFRGLLAARARPAELPARRTARAARCCSNLSALDVLLGAGYSLQGLEGYLCRRLRFRRSIRAVPAPPASPRPHPSGWTRTRG